MNIYQNERQELEDEVNARFDHKREAGFFEDAEIEARARDYAEAHNVCPKCYRGVEEHPVKGC